MVHKVKGMEIDGIFALFTSFHFSYICVLAALWCSVHVLLSVAAGLNVDLVCGESDGHCRITEFTFATHWVLESLLAVHVLDAH